MSTRKRAVAAVVAAAVVAAAVGLGWIAGRSGDAARQESAGTAPATAAGPSATDRKSASGSPAGAENNAAPGAQAEIGKADPFAALNCQARDYYDSPALSVTFTQPLDRKLDLNRYLQVIDTGPLSSEAADEAASNPVRAVQTGEPAVKGTAVEGSWSVGDNPRVAYFPYVTPRRGYVVRLAADLPGAAASTTLGRAAHCDVPTQAMLPAYYFASRGVVLPPTRNGGLPVVTVNQPEVDVQFLRVPPERVPAFFGDVLGVGAPTRGDEDDADDDDDYWQNWRYADNRSLKGSVGNWDLDRLHTLTDSVYQGRFVTDDKPNRRHVTFLPVQDIPELQEPGIYVAVMSQPGRFRYEYQVTYFYVSDVGLHARRYPDRIEAYAVSLQNGTPLAGAEFTVVDAQGKVIGKATSDEAGHVGIVGALDGARVIRARHGKAMTMLALGEPALDLSEYDTGGHVSRPNSLFVYAGRNLYRPGETFKVSVLPRDADGRLLTAAPLTATLKRPDGRTVRSWLWHPRRDMPGYVEEAIDLAADAQTGAWSLELRMDPASRQPDAAWKFQVEEFLPERMKLLLTSKDPAAQAGKPWQVSVQGDYLYGAPAAGNRLLASVQVRRNAQALPQQWPGFLFGDADDDTQRHDADLPETELDGEGRAALDVDTEPAQARSPMRVRVSASLLESGGRPVVRSIEQTFWPAGKLIAVRPLFDADVTREGAPAGFEVIRVDAQGREQPLAGAQLRLFREDRRYYWRYDDQRGWNSGYTVTDELTESRAFDIQGRTALSMPVKWGRYRLEVTDPETRQTLRYRFYAGWDAQDAESAGNRPDRVQMKLEGAPAKPGDTVALTLTPPHDGHALVTVEGDRMLWSKWVEAKVAGTRVEIPLDPSWKRHDLYVSATVFRPGSDGDRITPARALGLVYLPMDSQDRRLSVRLDAPAKVRPEQRSTVRVKVDGVRGGDAYVTLSAVDVGILNINQYPSPDPTDFLFGKHRYSPDLLDMYGKLIEQMDGTRGRLKWGGDAAMRGDTRSLPKKVKLVDLFSGAVRLDGQGQAEIPLDVPDFNGTLRLMAVAFTGDQYGHADAEMVAAAPVVAELNTPRFITPGDEAAIALDVTNLSGAERTMTVRLEALDPLSIADGVRTVTLKDKQRATLRFVARPTGSYGLAPVRLSVEADGGPEPVRIRRESVLQVQPAYGPERQVRRVRLNPGETFSGQQAWSTPYYADSLTASLTLSNRPPINVNKVVKGLLDYPYGCTEQTISATLPWVLIDESAADRYGLPKHSVAERQRRIDGAMARLAGLRGGSGSYSLWGSGEADAWITAYVLGFMQDARDQGFDVAESALEAPRNWLLSQLQSSGNAFGGWSLDLRRHLETGEFSSGEVDVLRADHRRFAGLAAAALALARDRKAPLSSLRALYDKYGERARSPLPLVQLAAAFQLMGDEGRAREAATAAMKRPYGVKRLDYTVAWMGDYGSPLRDYALSYALLSRYDLLRDQRETLLEHVAAAMNGRSYFSTQEQMALLLAAQAAGGDRDTPWRAVLQQGAGEQALQGAHDRTLEIDGQALGVLQLRNNGDRALFVELDVQGTHREPPAPRANAIRVQRSWFHPDGRPWRGGALRTGDILVARVRAQSPMAIPDALIVDRVPAGLEVENLNLSQGPEMRDWVIDGNNVADALDNPAIKHREFRDDRYVAAVALNRSQVDVYYLLRVVTPGRYAVPPAEAEDMYRPELRGVGEAWSRVEVVDRPAGGQ